MPSITRALLNRWTTPIWPVTLVGIVVGGVAGAWAVNDFKPIEATALVRVYQPVDPDQIITGTAPTSDSLQSYVSGEIAYLSSPGFSDAVAEQLNQNEPVAVDAIQDAQSSIISLSVSQSDPDSAERTVNAALDVYRDHLLTQSRERGQEAIDAINAVIGKLQAQIDAARPEPAPGDLQARINSLDLQRLSIEVQNLRGAPMQVVQPPTPQPQAGAPMSMLTAVGGGLVGGLLALGGAHLWRRRAGVITTRAALQDQIENAMVPTVRVGALTRSDDAYLPLARKLYAQLPSPRPGRILILGASSDSGTEYITGLFACAAEEQRDADRDADVVRLNGDPSADGDVTVIDGGSIESSPALTQEVQNASQVVIVAMIGRDVDENVQMAKQLALHREVPFSAVCTRRGAPWKNGSGADRRGRHAGIPTRP